MNRRLAFWALLLVALVPAAAASRLPRFVLPQHYVLTITPDLPAERFAGEVTIAVSVQRPVRRIELNAAEITFREATVASGGETQRADVSVDEQAERATLTLPRSLEVGPATIRISYDGVLNRRLRGFYIGSADGKKYLASQLEATDARRAFPSFDEPDLKATFQINVIADRQHAVISNEPIESETAGPGEGKKTVRFAPTPRLSTYHIALIVGDFACLSGTAAGDLSRICAAPERVELGRFALQATDDVLTELTRYFEIPYPFRKLDQIALTDFAAGAMENPGAVTYRERILLADERTAGVDSLHGSLSTIAHELAHMWFGDLVTMRWWDDIWLNEGFATWMARRVVARVRPQWTTETSDVAAAGRSMAGDVLLATRPIRRSAETPHEIWQLFDGIAYGKTAALLRMLEAYGGEEKFRDGVNLYMRRNAFGNASAGEFATAIDDATGRDVAEILSSYINQPGVPLVEVRSRCEGDANVVTLRQSRFLAGSERPAAVDSQIWTIPVCFGGGECVLLREREQTFRMAGCRQPLFANASGLGYFLTAYGEGEYARLAAERERLSPAERYALLRDGWFLVRAGKRDIADHLDLALALGPDRHVADSVLSQLDYVERYLVDDSQRARLQAAMRRLGEPLLRDLGWTRRPGESPEERRLRSDLVTFLGERAADPVTARRARELTHRWLRDRRSIEPEMLPEVLRVAAAGGNARLYESYLRRYRTTTDPREKARLLALLGAFRDPALLGRTLQLTLTEDVRSQDIASVLASVIANPAGREMGWRFLNENWNALETKIPPAHTGRVIGAIVGCDRTWSDRLRHFVAEHPLPQSQRAVAQTLERIETCAALRMTQQGSLAEWVGRQ
ncbi:MAG TPA: M1 family metallopeptidase [Thermoanaerobaculia bacterium]|nr:M1 family metallopeptidase [Thermoanaerobaculia bacterium]